MPKLGILAYGSLIEDPGKQLTPLIHDLIEGVDTPFRVEFARKSRVRGYGPTVIPVDEGGAFVRATILALSDTGKNRVRLDFLTQV